MTVNELIKRLEELRALGHGELPVIYDDDRTGTMVDFARLESRSWGGYCLPSHPCVELI